MVAIEVGAKDAQAGAGFFGQAGRDGDVGEARLAGTLALPSHTEIAEEAGGGTLHALRAAVFEGAEGVVAFDGFSVIQVIYNHQVEPAVAIVIEEGRSGGPAGVFNAGGAGDVFEERLSGTLRPT